MTRKTKREKNNMRLSIRIIALFACFLPVVSACTKKEQTTPPPLLPKAAAAKPVTVVQKQISSVKLAVPQTNQLDFSNKKDPFKPYVSVKATSFADAHKIKSQLPIHSFDVSQFRLIGVVADARGNKAMVVDPAHKGYVLKVGMTIGKNEGRIVRIDTKGVEVVEQFRDENNKIRKETIRIPLLRKP